MRSTVFQTPLPDGRIRCDVCPWHCALAEGETGRCRIRTRHDGDIVAVADGSISGAVINPIEDVRLWHFFPDSQALCIGGFGTPRVLADGSTPAYAEPLPDARSLAPERVVQFAQQRLCRGVVWTYGDPAVGFEWVNEGVAYGRAASRFTAITTSGYFSPAAFAQLGPNLTGMRLDVYGFTDQSYTALTGFTDWRAIFRLVAEARQRWNTHIEVALQLVPGVNDGEAEVSALAKWVRVALGSLTPLHIVGDQVDDVAAQPAVEAAREAGLGFVYGPAPHQPTRCPNCTWVVIERGAGPTQLSGVIDDTCEGCGAPLGLRTSLFRTKVRYEVVA